MRLIIRNLTVSYICSEPRWCCHIWDSSISLVHRIYMKHQKLKEGCHPDYFVIVVEWCVWKRWMLLKLHPPRHHDVIKWKHLPRYWPFVRGNPRSPVNSPHKGQWRGDLMFSLICSWINGWINNREAGDLRRHRAHYDVTVMCVSYDNKAVTLITPSIAVLSNWNSNVRLGQSRGEVSKIASAIYPKVTKSSLQVR